MTTAQLAPAIVLPLILWRVYVRVRRTIGRQRLVLKTLKVRIGIFGVITVLVAATAARYPAALLGLFAGLVVSLGLAWVGVRLTRFERTSDGDFYTPNTVIGVAITLLLVGRFAYRIAVIYPMIAASHDGGALPPTNLQSPLTYAVLGLLLGYYGAYYVGVVMRARHLETVSPRSAAPLT